MRYILASALAASFALCGAVLAQTKTGGTESPSNPATPEMMQHEEGVDARQRQGGMQGGTMQHRIMTVTQLRKDLMDAGFKDIQILADSFVVQAKDKDGNPVVMTLSPNSIFAFEALRSASNKPMPGASSGTSGGQQQPRPR